MAEGLMHKLSKPLMVLLGVLLMVTFLVGLSLNRMGGGNANFVVGDLNGHPLTSSDLQPARFDVTVIRRLPFLQAQASWLDPRGRFRASLQFYLLLREARQNGFFPDTDVARQWLADFKPLRQEVGEFLSHSEYAPENVLQAIADLEAVDRLAGFVSRAAAPSRPQLLHYLSRAASSIRIAYVKLSAADIAAMPAPSLALVKHLFQTYRTVLRWSPGSRSRPPLLDGHRYPFGYRYPDRVRIEFMKFDRAAELSRMKVTVADVEAAYRYYQGHRAKFKIAPSQGKTAVSAPHYKPFRQVRRQLIQRQLDGQVADRFRRMIRAALRMTGQPWKHVQISGYYRPLPAKDWMSYRRVAARLQHRFGYRPAIGRSTQWLSAAGLASLRGIGEAVAQQSGWSEPLSLPVLAMKVHELDPHAQGIGLLLHLQVGRDGPVLQDTKGNEYIYRLTAVSAAHNPTTLNAVRAVVERDARRLEAYRHALQRGRRLRLEAQKIGLIAAARIQHLSLRTPPPFQALTLSPRPLAWAYTGQPVYGWVANHVPGVPGAVGRQLARVAFRLARRADRRTTGSASWDVRGAQKDLFGENIHSPPDSHRNKRGRVDPPAAHPPIENSKSTIENTASAGYSTISVPIDSRLEMFVLQLLQTKPIPINQLRDAELRKFGAQQLTLQTRLKYLYGWLGYQAVTARARFRAAH